MTAPQNPFAYPEPITLESLDDLFAHHAHRLGGWRMEADGGDGGDGGGDDDKGKGDDYTAPATQADLDRIISDRLQRERAKFSDYGDLKAKAEKFDKAMEDALDEQQKAVLEARREGETEALAKANGKLVNAEARALAAHAKFHNPNLAARSIDLSGVSVGDDGEVDSDAIKTKLKELAEAEPYMVDDGKKPAPKSDRSQGGDNGGGDKPSVSRGREMWENRRGAHKKTA